MAFYGSAADLTNEKVEEKAQLSLHNIGRVDGGSSDRDKEFVGNILSEDETVGVGGHDALGSRGQEQGRPQSSRRMVGKWGSGFWKDRQMVDIEDVSTSEYEKDSKKSDSDFQVEEGGGSEDNASDVGEAGGDYYEHKEDGQNRKNQTEVSAEEMLSDDYYEHGGEERSQSISGNWFLL